MKTSKEAISIYEKVNRLWKRLSQPRLVGRLPSKTSYGEKNPNYEKHYTPVDFNTAKKFVKKAWSLYVADRSDYRGSKKFPYKIKQVQGNKHTWVWRGTLSINCDFGWCEINHDWSHYLGYMINLKRPHCAEHASLEFRMAKLIDKNYYQDSLANLKAEKKAEPAMKKNVIALRYERMLKRKAKWEKQAKRATNALRKVSKEIANYEKRHSQERLTTKMIPVSEKNKPKKRVSAKQRVKKLIEQYPFLDVEGPDETCTPTPWVYGQFETEDERDPYDDAHFCDRSSWLEIEERCLTYIELWNSGIKGYKG